MSIGYVDLIVVFVGVYERRLCRPVPGGGGGALHLLLLGGHREPGLGHPRHPTA